MPLESLGGKSRFWESVTNPVIGSLAAGVYVNPTLEVDEFGRITSISANAIPGTVQGLDEGISVPNGPFGIINFTGGGVTASDAGNGQINVFIPGGGTGIAIQEEGGLVSGGPHTIINYIGENITATNDGFGRVNVTVTDPDHIVRYRTHTIGISASNNIGDPIEAIGIVRTLIVTITSAYDPGTTIEIQDGLGTVLMPVSGNNPQLVGTYEFSLSSNVSAVGAGGEQLVAFVGNSPIAGAAVIEVIYHTD